jgi:hypothetical protein
VILLPCELRYWFKDIEDSYIDVSFYVPSSNLSLAMQFGDSFADILIPLSSCNITEYDFIIRAREHPYPVPSGTEPPINKHAVFIFDTATPGNRHTVQVASVRDSVLTTSPDPLAGITLDLTNTDVIAFRDSLLNGDGTIEPIDQLGDDLTALSTAYQQWRAVDAPLIEKG